MFTVSRLKNLWPAWRQELALTLARIGILLAAFCLAVWALESGLQARSFLIGFFTGVIALFLHFKNEAEAVSKPTKQKPENWDEMVAERHEAETQCARWMAKRAELECTQLRREMEEKSRYDPPDE